MNLDHHDIEQILKIFDSTENLDEIDLECDGLRLHIKRHGDLSLAGPSMAEISATSDLSPTDGGANCTVENKTGKTTRGDSIHQATSTAPPSPLGTMKDHVPDGMVAIRAPMLGTFYRSPSPGKKPFVEVGQQVASGDTVCLIEVMKLFNSVKASVDGVISGILIEDASLVEYNQVVILIDPSVPVGGA